MCTTDEKKTLTRPPCPPDPCDARQLRPLLRRDLQRQGDHGLERQLHGAEEPQDYAG